MSTINIPRSSYKGKIVRRTRAFDKSPVSTIVPDERPVFPDECHEDVLFIWFDPSEQSNVNLVGQLRAINDSVKSFADASTCLKIIESSKEKIFFICSVCNNELIAAVHGFAVVEAIFILNSTGETIRGDLPKLFGIFNQHEELVRVLKDVFETYEQVQLEEFAFENGKIFLWSQLWKEELNRKLSINKQTFFDMTRFYYRDNARIIEIINEFEKSYRPNESIHWCCRSPFPTRFLLHALRSHSKTRLTVCRFLFADSTRLVQQQPKRKTSEQFYRGMKLSSQILDEFEHQIGRIVCTSSFFPCTKSRTNALTLASLPTYRPDLLSVFFKIDCDTSSLYAEVAQKNSPTQIVFDVCTSFRIVHVNRGPMSIVKMKTAADAGKKIALDYLENNKDQTIQSMLDELLKPPKPSTPPPPPAPEPVEISIPE